MTPERYKNLEGRSVLILESDGCSRHVSAECFVGGMKPIEEGDLLPRNLLEYMNEKGFEAAIIHPCTLRYEQEILNAHQAGKKIVVIEGVWCSAEQEEMYRKLEEAGVSIFKKSAENPPDGSVGILDKLFAEG